MSECRHPQGPSGYSAWQEWAESMARRYVQVLCPKCNRWAIWRKPREGDRRDENGFWQGRPDEIPPGLEGPLDPDYDLNRDELGPSSRPPGCPEC